MSRRDLILERTHAARDVATHLKAWENSIDASIAQLGALLQALPAARRRSNIEAAAGQDAFEQVMLGANQLTAARRAAVEAHAGFLETSRTIGVPETNWGTEDKTNTPRVVEVPAAA